MQSNSEFIIFELNNGLKVVHKQVNRPVAHFGLMINAGTRDELEDEHGVAHFIEHAIFKGTQKRRAYHILNRLDSVGGEIDAYTTKETTCIYASFLTEYYDRAIDLLGDIVQNSQFPEKELEKEKEVIFDEINSYLDSPADQIYDDFENQVFKDHQLGKGILGTVDSVKSISKEKIQAFIKRLYKAENMVISSVGNISEKKLRQKIEKHFSTVNTDKSILQRTAFSTNAPRKIVENRGGFQTHCIMGKTAHGANNPNRLQLVLLNNILGGPAMNSILNMKIREKYGFTYNIESNYAIYTDCGLLSIYLAADDKYIDRCIKAIRRELKMLRSQRLSSSKMHLAKQQLKGQLAISRESNSSLMLSYAKSLLLHNRIDTIETIQQKIDQLDSASLLESANMHLDESEFDFLFFKGK